VLLIGDDVNRIYFQGELGVFSRALHIEWKIPENITGVDQARGNSGVFLAATGPGDDGYELQILDSYNNATYFNNQVGSLYKQANPGESESQTG
jgi:hypothetical protein